MPSTTRKINLNISSLLVPSFRRREFENQPNEPSHATQVLPEVKSIEVSELVIGSKEDECVPETIPSSHNLESSVVITPKFLPGVEITETEEKEGVISTILA